LSSSEIQRPIALEVTRRTHLRVLHSSDLHGNLSTLLAEAGPFDLWLDTGDFFPNEAAGEVTVEAARERRFQRRWLREQVPTLVTWLAGRPALLMPGNHDYIELSEVLVDAGADARRIVPSGVDCAGLRWAGFREVKWMDGRWNGECQDFSEPIAATFSRALDVLVTHAPPEGVLDSELDFGIPALTTALRASRGIRAHFFGHDHRRGGEWVDAWGMRFFNGAKTVRCRNIAHSEVESAQD
jgi:hypothetical protein